MEAEGRGPIRRRIDSLTIELEPFEKSLTDQEAVIVRNVIESLLQDYFFEVQPWVVQTETEKSLSDSSDREVEKIGDGGNSASDLPASQSASVTYVGLAQILENKQTEDQTGVVVTMNGLVYFAEGSKNIPDEDELLQMMEEQALGDSQVVVDALRDFFPTQQPLVVTVKTPTTKPPTSAPVESPPIVVETPGSVTVPAAIDMEETKPPVTNFNDGFFQSDQEVVLGTSNEIQSLGLNDDSSRETMILGGSIGFVILFMGTIIGLFAVQRRRKRAVAYRANEIRHTAEGNEYLVDNGELGLALSQEDWKVNSNVTHRDVEAEVTKIHTAETVVPITLPVVIPTEDREAELSPTNATLSYLSSFFQRKSPIAEQHLEAPSTKSSDDEEKYPKREKETQELNMSVYQFTDDGSSDFSDVVSIQPHVVSLKSLESFEEQHTSMTRQDYVVQKDQLGSSFEEPPINLLNEIGREAKTKTSAPSTTVGTVESLKATPALINMPTGQSETSRDTLNYSSSSTSSREPQHQQLQQDASGAASILNDLEREAEKEDQRIRYTMMPNPYVRHRQGKGDRSAPCVLKATEITAASLARASGINNGNNVSILSSSSSSSDSDSGEATSPANNSRGMIPKLAAPSWWSSQDGENDINNNSGDRPRRSRSGRSSPAVDAAFREEDLAYSADEENTFGVPESDGWDPTDTTLSSIGDVPSQDDIKMVEFQVGKVSPPPSPPGEKYPSPVRVPSPSSRKNIEVAKAVLQRMKSSSESDNGGHKLGESIATVPSDDVSEEIRFDSSLSL